MKRVFLIFFSFYTLLSAEIDYRVENSNILVDNHHTYDYNRLRLNLDYYNGSYFAKLIADGVNYYGKDYIDSPEFSLLSSVESDTPFKIKSESSEYKKGEAYAKIHRAYLGYEDDKNRATLGLQNITMGVGRFWTPTNLFNPKNIYLIEVDETLPVMALVYTRHINDMSDLSVVSSVREDNSLKYAAKYKSFLDYADVGVNLIYSNETKMIGYELEANLFDTGVEVRSEGSYIESNLAFKDVEFFQAIVGADYGFVNGVNLTVESLYSSEKFDSLDIYSNLDSEILQNMTPSKFYAGTSLSYVFNIFLDASVMYIDSFDEYKPFKSATFNYTLNDYNTFLFGVMSQDDETYYIKWQLSF